MRNPIPYPVILVTCTLGLVLPLCADEALLTAKAAKDWAAAFAPSEGWKVENDTLLGESPTYNSLPGTDRAGFPNDAWTYFTVHPTNLWRYAIAGNDAWTNYSVECTVQVDKAAPITEPRPGATFFNYQWGREAVGSDAGILVRYRGPDDYYMVRLSTAYDHVELWKTHGGVVQVKALSLDPGKPYRVAVTAAERWLIVTVEGKEVIRYHDPVEPILAGRFGLGVRESCVRFSDLRVAPAAPNLDVPPPHQTNLRQRKWVGRDYIFDHDEPIGWFGWMAERGLELREVKLRPGLMPLVSPHAGMELYNYTPGGDLKVTGEGNTFTFNVKLWRTNEYEVTSQWQISFDPARGYVLDKRARFTPLTEKAGATLPPVEDLYFYQLAGPATEKLPLCRTQPNWCIAECESNRIVAFPNAHYIWNNGLGDPRKSSIRPDGSFVSTIDGWGIACRFPPDNTRRFYSEQCHWGLDAHMAPLGPGITTGQVYESHVQISLWDKVKTANALTSSVLPAAESPNPPELFRHTDPVNHLDRIYPGLNGESVRLWTGKYHVDRTIGRNDKVCMRIDTREIQQRLDDGRNDDRPNVWQGPSYWTGPYLAARYRFGLWVKADSFKGRVSLLADGFNHPKGAKLPEVRKDLAVNGKIDWTYMSFEADFPRQCFNWVLRIDATGEGSFWVDDLEIVPLP